jgi:DNA mismatch repair protein MutS
MDNILKQFYDLKSENPEALILFRTGDFYEMYSEDAEEASKILGITLTKSTVRKDKDGEPLKIAGFPHHALDTYLPKLIRAGKRVAICDQLEDPHTKKLVKRGISELVSNN